MREIITADTLQVPITAQNLVKHKNGTEWYDWHFKCPVCECKLSISSILLVMDDDNDTRWVGNCPSCDTLIKVWRPN